MKKCPYCDEDIKDKAIKCRYCGEMLEEKNKEKKIDPKTEQKKESITKNETKKIKVKVDFKSKVFNFFIILIYFSITIVGALLYAGANKAVELADKDYSAVASYFITILVIFSWAGIHYYRKSRGDLLPNFKDNLKKFFKGIISLGIALLILFALFASERSLNNDQAVDDMKDFTETMKNIKIDPNGNNEELLNSINSLDAKSGLGKAVQNYITEKYQISQDYTKGVENLGDVVVYDGKEDNLIIINEVVNNLDKLKELGDKYQKDNTDLLNSYVSLKGLYNTGNSARIGEFEKEYFNKENEFIIVSKEMYKFLIKYHDEVIISNGKAVMEGRSGQELWEEHLVKFTEAQNSYIKAEENLNNYRAQIIEKRNNM